MRSSWCRSAFPVVLLLILVSTWGCGSGDRPGSPEEMADQLVKAINTKDKAGFENLLCTKEVMKMVLDKSQMDEALKGERLKNLDNEYEDFMKDARQSWEELMAAVKEAGMDQGDLVRKQLDKEQETRDNVMGAEVEMIVGSGGKTAKVAFVAVEQGGWYLLPQIGFRVQNGEMNAPSEVPEH